MVNINFFGDDAELDHIAIDVKSIDQEGKCLKKINDSIQRVNVAFFYLNNVKIELVEPASDDSPVNNLLLKGNNIYHLCFKVNDLKKSIKTARGKGFHCIINPVKAAAFNNKKIAWVYNKTFGLFELVER